MKIVYEPHPVTPERKAELRAQGFKIIDARFKPQDATAEPVVLDEPTPEPSGIPKKSDIATMKKSDLLEWLEAHGVDNADGTVAELRDILRAVLFVE